MKDIDTLLSKHTPKPNREISDSFTQNVITQIKHVSSKERRSRGRPLLQWIRTAPGIAIVTIFIALGGLSTYAATTGWFGNIEGATVTPSSNDPTIVTVNMGHCSISWINGPGAISSLSLATYANFGELTPLGNGPVKFKILQPRKITAAQVRYAVLALCEQQSVTKFYQRTYPDWFPTGSSTPYTLDQGKVLNITSNTITIQFAWGQGSSLATVTYPIFSRLPVYKNGVSVSLATLHTGDSVALVVKQPQDFNNANWRPSKPTLANSTLASISLTQYNWSNDQYAATNWQVFTPLSLYIEERDTTAASSFYRKHDPDWFTQAGAARYRLYYGAVENINKTRITLRFRWDFQSRTASFPIESNLTTYFSGRASSVSSLHNGDNVVFVINQTDSTWTPTYAPPPPSASNASLASVYIAKSSD